jgi:glutamate racemase
LTLGATDEIHSLPGDALLGMFDSGLGGLTVLRQLLALRPGQPCIYVADTARVPYGGRSATEIRVIAAEVAGFLRSKGCQALLMACNTSNALAFDVVKAHARVPVVGLIDSVAKMLKSSRVGVLATPATAASGAYGKVLRAAHGNITVVEVGCPFFVPAIENHDLGSSALTEAAKSYLDPLLMADVEAIVLGCTHYPLLEPLLKQLLPDHIELIDPALAAVDQFCQLLPAPQPLTAGLSPYGSCRLLVTGDVESFAAGAGHWLGAKPRVEPVCLQIPG